MRKFGRKKGPRKLFVQGLASNLIMREKITTTTARAKEIRPVVEKMVTMARKGDLASFRNLMKKLPKKSAEKLYYDIAPKYKSRKGGYLRITKTGKLRKRDASEQSVIEFV
ncbi:MAG: 50S ribosomal protein L17 [Candidatus Harrisonbacteria bacterium CG10_big_fil_rev_8_21_14_0_10_44_23]|uniref:50S ribosomal protein L17 n=1 Tax=Candidatus Harrisonbacteria bacterium CG10_big_fil_rev_8_21_14_0_10_44_23 TaxID=1974585 RepID=A0A2H0UQC3_9BACT|nr:MAG: 50S ribosomal protein L17 [Candidatus Harrisonbacteria bacterium CG10_big_fil_rev_8_21_14_0_10_44_23]